MTFRLEDCVANTLSNTLSKLCPSDITKSKSLEVDFRAFFEKGTAEQCWQLIPTSHKVAILKSFQPENSISTSDHIDNLSIQKDSLSHLSSLSRLSSKKIIQAPLHHPDTRSTSTCVEETSGQQSPSACSSSTRCTTSGTTQEASLNPYTCIERHFSTKIPNTNSKRIKHLIRIARAFEEAERLSVNSYEKLWSQKDEIFEGSEYGLDKFCRLQRGRRRIKLGTVEYDCVARLTLVFVNHHIDHLARLLRSKSKFKHGQVAISAAFTHLCEVSNIPLKTLKDDYKKSRNYLHLIAMTGPGSLLELGYDVNSLWEKHMTKNSIKAVLEYRKSHLPAVEERAQSLHIVAAHTIIRGFLAYGWSLPELLSSCTSLIEHIRPYLKLYQSIDKIPYQYGDFNRSSINALLNPEVPTQGQQLSSVGSALFEIINRVALDGEQAEESREETRNLEVQAEADSPPNKRRCVNTVRSHDSSLANETDLCLPQPSNEVGHGHEGVMENPHPGDANINSVSQTEGAHQPVDIVEEDTLNSTIGALWSTDQQREIELIFNNPQEKELDSNLQEPFHSPVMSRFQSGLENHQQCIVAMFPRDWEQDVTFSITVDREAGLAMIRVFNLQCLPQIQDAQGPIWQYSDMPKESLHLLGDSFYQATIRTEKYKSGLGSCCDCVAAFASCDTGDDNITFSIMVDRDSGLRLVRVFGLERVEVGS